MPTSPPPTAPSCSNTCTYDTDGLCDDGGQGADFQYCLHGTDCEDCGARPPSYTYPSPPPLSTSPTSPPASPPQSPLLATLVTSFAASGDVSDYDDATRAAIKAVIATEAQIAMSTVTLDIRAGSVIITATITMPASSADVAKSRLVMGVFADPVSLQARSFHPSVGLPLPTIHPSPCSNPHPHQAAFIDGGVGNITILEISSPPALSIDGAPSPAEEGGSIGMVAGASAGGVVP